MPSPFMANPGEGAAVSHRFRRLALLLGVQRGSEEDVISPSPRTTCPWCLHTGANGAAMTPLLAGESGSGKGLPPPLHRKIAHFVFPKNKKCK